ncbi:MAG: hypothetical protein QM698_16760 [Micropepsaceae bacterium]
MSTHPSQSTARATKTTKLSIRVASALVAAFAIGASLSLSAPSQDRATPATDDYQDRPPEVYPSKDSWSERIDQAVFSHGRLWLLSAKDQLSSLLETSDKREPVNIDSKILGLGRRTGDVTALTCLDAACETWGLRQFDGSDWQLVATISSNGDEFAAMTFTDTESIILTSRRVVVLAGDVQHAIEIAVPPGGQPPATSEHYGARPKILKNGRHLYLGFDQGEWGGGLQRIDMTSGALTVIEDKSSGGLHCQRPLDSACAPVTGLTTAPWNPDCLVATVAMAYAGGRVLEICGDRVRRLYFDFNAWSKSKKPGPDGEIDDFETVGFSGVVTLGPTVIAIGDHDIYQIDETGAATKRGFSTFKLVDGVYVDFSQSGFVMALHTFSTAWDEDRRKLLGPYIILAPR